MDHARSVKLRDMNMEVAGQLSDMALVHDSPYGRSAYERASMSVLGLDEPLDEIVANGSARAIPNIGRSSERVILEYLERGESPTVERAVTRSAKRDKVLEARAARTHFLSRASVLRVLRSRRRGAITPRAYRGDLQTHSSFSDGRQSIAQMAEAARGRGYSYLAVSDHSYGLKQAHGMSMADAKRRKQEIDALNRRWDGEFRVISAVEANIPDGGGVDLKPEELRLFDLVLAAAHTGLRRAEDQTARMLATVRHRGVHVLAHPRGRTYSRRGVLARWDEVFAEAAGRGVAIEIDGDPNRQDLDYTLASRAHALGCLFALDSDAHAGDELGYAEFALAHARLAGIPAARIINTWPVKKLLDWARR